MQATVLYGPRDIRFEDRDAPTIMKPTDAVIRIAATCACGSDLWPYRGINAVTAPTPDEHHVSIHFWGRRPYRPRCDERLS
jgi:threonine dehydrogenase-like Zn-dependent dehydrogenase